MHLSINHSVSPQSLGVGNDSADHEQPKKWTEAWTLIIVARGRMIPASQMRSLDILKKADTQLKSSVHQGHKSLSTGQKAWLIE